MTEPSADTAETYDLLVIGGGPAGLAAAAEAADAGLSVGLVDERPTFGGQIYKQFGLGFDVRSPSALGRDYLRGRRLIEAVERTAVRPMPSTSAVAIRGTEVVLVGHGLPARVVNARRVLLAPGAHDRPVVFPGWTLPGVLTAGAAQAIVKTQRVLPGRRLVFAGSGPLALAFPAQLAHYGASVALTIEAGRARAPRDVLRLAAAARGNLGLLRDAAVYRAQLYRARVPLRYGRIVVRAEGEDGSRRWCMPPWTLTGASCQGPRSASRPTRSAWATGSSRPSSCCGSPAATSPTTRTSAGRSSRWTRGMRTTVAGISAAGDGAGVGGAFVAADEGRLAALGAALDLAVLTAAEAERRAGPVRARLRRKQAFRSALRRLHTIGPGIYELATDATVVCRCEEIGTAELVAAVASSADLNVVKGFTRAGMGLCQGKSCQRQIAALVARRHGLAIAAVPAVTPRLPVRPVPIGAIADDRLEDAGFFTR